MEDVVLVGVVSKGDVLARRLAAILTGLETANVQYGRLNVSKHRDDLHLRAPDGGRPASQVPDIGGKVVVLVDDVIHHGRTARAAMDAINSFGRPARIQFAALIDRGHRELPIRADYVGKNLPTAANEKVRVRIGSADEVDGVWLIKPKGAG